MDLHYGRSLVAKMRLFGMAAACLFALQVGQANAGLIEVNFEFGDVGGPWIDFHNLGVFTFDDSIIPDGGGYVEGTDLLTSLDMTAIGFDWDETTANTGWFSFTSTGDIEAVTFGNRCIPGSCSVNETNYVWFINLFPNTEFEGQFVYRLPQFQVPELGYARVTSITSAVPLPPTLWLFLCGLVFIWMRKR